MKYILLAIVRAYQFFLRPLFPPACRFHPSCSHYSHQAISKHGVLKGGWLTIKRVGRCNPWNAGGFDPIP